MLNLVKKFKSQSIAEEDPPNPQRNTGSTSNQAKASDGDAASDKDSGTESDEELERIESGLMPAQVSSSESRAPVVPSSPICGFSDQDSNSLDSMGGESGILLRDSDSETPTPSEILYNRNIAAKSVCRPTHGYSLESMENAVGAFKPVPRRQSGGVLANCQDSVQARERSFSTGEKRKWSQIKDEGRWNFTVLDREIRETLMAARRTPVRLLVPSPALQLHSPPASPPKVSPRKKHRSAADHHHHSIENIDRPSLNFEKMRENMMKPAQKFGRNSRQKVKSCGVDEEWVFRPVETPTEETPGFSSA